MIELLNGLEPTKEKIIINNNSNNSKKEVDENIKKEMLILEKL